MVILWRVRTRHQPDEVIDPDAALRCGVDNRMDHSGPADLTERDLYVVDPLNIDNPTRDEVTKVGFAECHLHFRLSPFLGRIHQTFHRGRTRLHWGAQPDANHCRSFGGDDGSDIGSGNLGQGLPLAALPHWSSNRVVHLNRSRGFEKGKNGCSFPDD